MTAQDSVTEGEVWRPLGVQCQVHCTPLMQASTRAAADIQDGCVWGRSCAEKKVLGQEEAKGDIRFEFPLFILFI